MELSPPDPVDALAATRAGDPAGARTTLAEAHLPEPQTPLPEMQTPLPDALTSLAGALASGPRQVLGVAGEPGAGKSTVAAQLVTALAPRAVLVPMDGFHLAQAELVRLGRADRKGAPDTFDAAGFVALLRRLREQRPGDPVVYAPTFDRALEEPVAGAVPVDAAVPLVVVEGNYLLLDDGPWAQVARLLDECWYVEVAREVRLERLVARHVAFGKDAAAARAWALGPDERNAGLIRGTRARATRVVALR